MHTSTDPSLRPARPEDTAAVVGVWHRAVLATHTFLPDAAVERLHSRIASDFLPHVELWVATDEAGTLTGFVGLSGRHVEMLFVDPEVHGQGVGTALLALVRAADPAGAAVTVDVNEQNPDALAFYEHRGFVRTGRSEVDGDGEPYPLVHLTWAAGPRPAAAPAAPGPRAAS